MQDLCRSYGTVSLVYLIDRPTRGSINQQLSETLREDARSGCRRLRFRLRESIEENLVFLARFAETVLPTGYSLVRA